MTKEQILTWLILWGREPVKFSTVYLEFNKHGWITPWTDDDSVAIKLSYPQRLRSKNSRHVDDLLTLTPKALQLLEE